MTVIDDSLVILKRRQTPPLQTGRGNYATTWTLAGFYELVAGDVTNVGVGFVLPPEPIEVLLFGSDVPFLQMLIYEEKASDSFRGDVAAWIAATSANLNAIDNWARTVSPDPYEGPEPPVYAGTAPIVCVNGVEVVPRAPLTASWNATDAGQGALVTCQTEQVANVQGFPVTLQPPVCRNVSPPQDLGAVCFLLVGFEAQINAGLGIAHATGANADEQPAYIPILLSRADYTPAMRANRNVITQTVDGTLTDFVIVGLWN
jgi:hypothetical protein